MSNLTQISREQAGEEWDDIPSDAVFTVQSKSRGAGRIPQSLIPNSAGLAAGAIATGIVVSVKQSPFLAKGDGVTDDTAAIQAAIDYAYTIGAEVFFPGGTYIVGTLDVPTGAKMRGSGYMQTHLKRTTDVTILSLIGAASTGGAFQPTMYGVTISDMDITSQGMVSSEPLILIRGGSALAFTRVRMQSYSGTAPLLDCAQVWDSRFVSCLFHGGGNIDGSVGAVRLRAGIDGYGQTKESIFANCWWESYNGPGIEISRPDDYTATKCEMIYFAGSKMESLTCVAPSIAVQGNNILFDQHHISFKATTGPVVDLKNCKNIEGSIGYYYIQGAVVTPSCLLNADINSWNLDLKTRVMVGSQPTGANLITIADDQDTRNNLPITGATSRIINGRAVSAFDNRRMLYTLSTTLPTGLGWDSASYPVVPSITETLSGEVTGSAGTTPEALFDLHSTARSAPTTTYYVSTSGSDSNSGLSTALALRSLHKAQDLANATGQPARIYVDYAAGGYERANSWPGGADAWPTVDTAWIATDGWVVGGRPVQTGIWDTVTGFALDGTYTNCYAKTVANCARVVDRLAYNRFGNHPELAQVATAAICNVTPNSWVVEGGSLYIRRGDGAAVTETNTRYFRDLLLLQIKAQVNIYMDGFDIQGCGSSYGVIHINTPSSPTTPKVIVAKNVLTRYGGGVGATDGKGFAPVNWFGLVARFNCRSEANANNGFGGHNIYSGTLYQLNINCVARDNGRGVASVSGLKGHETGVTIDIGGRYEGNRGGNCHFIDTSKTYMLGTLSKDDQGDKSAGGTLLPVGVRAANSAEVWCERVRVEQPLGTLAFQAATATTSKIHQRDCAPTVQGNIGGGVFDTF